MQTCLPIRGTASEVSGIISVVMFRKNVRESRMVTSVEEPETAPRHSGPGEGGHGGSCGTHCCESRVRGTASCPYTVASFTGSGLLLFFGTQLPNLS